MRQIVRNHTLFVRLLFAIALVFGVAGVLSAQTLQITTASLPGGVENVSYPSQALNATGGTQPYTWSITGGSLPSGLTLDPSSGIIQGTPATGSAGTYNFVAKVTDSSSSVATKSLTIIVATKLAINPITLPTGTVGAAYGPQTLTVATCGSATCGTAPYSWSVISGALPSNLSLSTGGVISGTPVVSGVYPFTVRATDTSSPSQSATINLSISVPPSITTTSLPNGAVGTAYSQSLTTAPGTATPYTWSVTAGALPMGLTLDPAQGVISGTPGAAGIFNFTITATDTAGKSGSQALSMTVQAQLLITATSPLPVGVVGVFYSQVIGTGPSANWSAIAGTLPPGLSLTSTGSLSGTPQVSGAFDFTVQASGGTPTQTTSAQPFHLVINPALTITTLASLPNATVNTAYSTTLTASGGVSPYTWTSQSTLPTGLSLSTGGVLSGTPTVPGNYSLTIQVADSFSPQQITSRTFTLTVASTLTITTSSLPNGAPGTAYSQTLAAAAGTAPLSWSITAGSLPAGLNLSPSTGAISGTPTTPGTSNFTVTVTDSSTPAQTTSKALSITIITPTLTITSTSPLPTGVSGVFYSQQLAATGVSPIAWSQIAGVLPPGLSLSGSGSLAGTPNVSGTFGFTVQATGGSPVQTAQMNFNVTINPALTVTTPSTLPAAMLNVAYSVTLGATGGVSPYTWASQSALPPGLSLSTAGVLSGTPTVPNTYTLTVQVSDSFTPTQTASRTFSLTVAATLTVTTSSLANGLISTAYSQFLSAAGGTPPYSWSLTAGTLPAGLNLSNTGAITGTPSVAGTSNITVAVTDSANQTASKALSITIVQQTLAITTVSPLPLAVAGVFYSQQMTFSGVPSVTWSQTSGILPPGLALSSSGALAGTPSTSGNYTFTVQAAGGNPIQTVTQPIQVTVNPALTITTVALTSATLNGSYNQQLTATGGLGPYTWANLTALPAGLTLNSSTGVLSGTPTTPGNYTVAIQVTDSFTPTANTASRTFALPVATTLLITTSSLPNGAVGIAYSQTLAAAAGTVPYTWTASSGVPGGLALSTSGVLSGVPTAAGTFNMVVSVTDSSSQAQSVSSTITITIQALLSITTSAQLPLGVVGAFYSQSVAASGPSALTWSVSSGALPPGIVLSASGALQGTPAVSGAYDFTLQVTGGTPTQTANQSFHLVINAPLTITTTTLPNAGLGNTYSVSLAANGGVSPYTWTNQGNLPPGLTLSAAGVISGTPAALGSTTFTVQVSDSFTPKQTASHSFTIIVATSAAITTLSVPNAIQNQAYSQQLQAVGTSPFTWVVTSGSLPPGLTLSPTGLLQGTPTTVISATFTIGMTDSLGSGNSQTFTLVVDPPVAPLSITSLPATLNPTQSSGIALSLASPHPSDLTGQLVLTFASAAEVPGDDPMTQFSTGTRTVSFTIPANTTAAVFPSDISLLTGTVAGTVTLTATIQNGPSIVVATVTIPAIVPQMTNVTATRTTGGIQVQITGYSSSRRVNSVEFDFTIKNGSTTQTQTLTRSVDTDFSAWFTSSASAQFGGSFSFVQSFTIQGDTTLIQSVTVRLSNAQGPSASKTVTIQ